MQMKIKTLKRLNMVNKLLLILFLFVIFGCITSNIRIDKEDLIKGQRIYFNLLPQKPLKSFQDTTNHILNRYSFLNDCNQFYCTYYLIYSAFVEKKAYDVRLVSLLVEDIKLKTNVFRGSFGFEGVSYTKQNAKKDLKDWKKKLNCE